MIFRSAETDEDRNKIMQSFDQHMEDYGSGWDNIFHQYSEAVIKFIQGTSPSLFDEVKHVMKYDQLGCTLSHVEDITTMNQSFESELWISAPVVLIPTKLWVKLFLTS